MVHLFRHIGKQMKYPSGIFGKILFAWMTGKTIEHARWTLDLLDIKPGDDVLEIGFGNGANLDALLRRSATGTITGIEISETAIKMAAKRNKKAIEEGKIKLYKITGSELPFPPHTFDKACTIATVYVIENPATIFREMYRVLKPGGAAAITFPVKDNFEKFKPVKAEKFFLHDLEYLQRIFREAGFREFKTEHNPKVKFGAYSLLGYKSTPII